MEVGEPSVSKWNHRTTTKNRHMTLTSKSTTKSDKLLCEICAVSFTRKTNLNRHIRLQHEKVQIAVKCHICDSIFATEDLLLSHFDNAHPAEHSFQMINTALNGSVKLFRKNVRISFIY